MTLHPAKRLKHFLTSLFIVFFLFIGSSVYSQVNQLWGLTSAGGANGGGVLFSYYLNNSSFVNRTDFNSTTGINPFGSLLLYNNKLYAPTRQGGLNGIAPQDGVLFEYDPELRKYTDKKDLSYSVTGAAPTGSLVLFGTKLYGMTTIGGTLYTNGVIFEWDPSTNIYTIKKEFTNNTSTVQGKNPYGSLVYYAGTNKLYGMTKAGGVNGLGVIFSYDPTTNIYTKLYDFVATSGSSPQGSLIVYNNLLYGMTQAGGSGGNGVIFQFNPTTSIYTNKINLLTISGQSPSGDLVVYNNKLYGLTALGGLTNQGIIFEWDPTSPTATRRYDMTVVGGSNPNGTLLLFNNKMYGMTNLGGTAGLGTIFEWDPSASNTYTKEYDFTGTTNGANPERTALIVVPAPVASGTANTCEVTSNIIIDASNYNSWVPIVDSKGDIVAEIKANGNIMGTVSASFYTQNTPKREDIHNKLYLGRNIRLSPQFQPLTKDSVRLYLKKYEVDSLINALNSHGQPTGIAGIAYLGVFKNDEPCQSTGVNNARPVTNTYANYGVDYYLQFADTTLSTYYFANDTFQYILPIQMEYFKGVHNRFSNTLRWKATCSRDLNFDVERSADAIHFEKLGNVVADTSNCGSEFLFTDPHPLAETNYYRIRINEDNSLVKYSDIIQLQGAHSELTISIVPTMVEDGTANLHINAVQAGTLGLVVTDLQGRTMLKQQINVSPGLSATRLNVQHLASGIYQVYGVINNVSTPVQRFVKK